MKQPINFVECISALNLHLYHCKKNKSFEYGDDFWFIINHLDNKDLIKWTNRLWQIKGLVVGKSFTKLTDILHNYNVHKNLYPKQKRWLAMTLLTYWDNISLFYEY